MHRFVRHAVLTFGALVLCIEGGAYCARVQARQDPTTQPLLGPASLTYQGAFCLPQTSGAGIGQPSSFHDGAEGMGFDPYTNTLVVQGNYRYGNAARVTIPAPSLSSCPRAAVSGGWLNTLWRFPQSGNPDSGDVRLESFLPQANGDLVASFHHFYDANNSQVATHARMFANGTVSAKVTVGTVGRAGFVSGWMTPIPTEWQPLLGGAALTGNGSRSIISTMSLGPAAWVFNPSAVGSGANVPATEVLGYPINHPTLGTCETGTVFNCWASNRRAGLAWLAGSRTLVYAHQICTVPPVYGGGGWNCSAPATQFLWLDANELVAVKNGQKLPWQVTPYLISAVPNLTGIPVGIAYDAAGRRLFISERWADGPQPKIHVYRVDTGTSPSEVCGDGIDNDGDGLIDEGCPPPQGPDTTPPTLTITLTNTTVVLGQPVGITLTANDPSGLRCLVLTMNGADVPVSPGPYDCFPTVLPSVQTRQWTPTALGTFTLTAVVRDNSTAQNQATASTTVTVVATPPPPVDAVMGPWTYSSTTPCSETWTRVVLVPASNGGVTGPTSETRPCPPPPAWFDAAPSGTVVLAVTMPAGWTRLVDLGVVGFWRKD